jgi:hypothetical protein
MVRWVWRCQHLFAAAAVVSLFPSTIQAFSLKEIKNAEASLPEPINWGPWAKLHKDALQNELVLRGLANLSIPWENERRLQDHNAGGCTNVETQESMIVLCALALMLDVTPGFQSEGCPKVGPYCRAICDPATLDVKKGRYQNCIDKYNPSTNPDGFGKCFFPRLIDNIIDAFSYTGQVEKTNAESVNYLCALWDMPGSS